MAKVKTFKLDKHSQVSMTLNLKEMFKQTVASQSLREKIGQDIIKTILERTSKGFGVTEGGNQYKFDKYSKKYKELKGQSNVDLELIGEMLSDITILDDGNDYLEVGILGPTVPRAHGHMTGQEGKGPLPQRRFLDLTKREMDSIVSKYKSDVVSQKKVTARDILNSRNTNDNITDEDIRAAIDLINSGRASLI
jgi:phage gpG-like protein